MRTLQLCLASLALSLLAGCAEPNVTEIWEVRADPGVCDNGNNVYYCAGYHVVDTDRYGAFYEHVAGFDAEWGHSYQIEVERFEVEDPGPDGSSVRYELVEILDEDVQPGLEFDLALIFDWLTIVIEADGGLLGDIPFTCAPEVCAEVTAQRGTFDAPHQDIQAVFRFGSADQLFPLELVSSAIVDK